MLLSLGSQASMQNTRTNSKQLKTKWSVSLLYKRGSHSHVGHIERSQINTSVLIIESNFFVYVMPTRSFIILVLHIVMIILLGCLKFIDTTQETAHLISDYQKSKGLLFLHFPTVRNMIGIHFQMKFRKKYISSPIRKCNKGTFGKLCSFHGMLFFMNYFLLMCNFW